MYWWVCQYPVCEAGQEDEGVHSRCISYNIIVPQGNLQLVWLLNRDASLQLSGANGIIRVHCVYIMLLYNYTHVYMHICCSD